MSSRSLSSVRPDPATIPLADFLTRCFAPARLTSRRARWLPLYRNAVEWLQRQLINREPMLADLTPANLADVQRAIAAAGFSVATMTRIKKQLSTLAKHAWRIGLLPTWKPVALLPHEQAPASFHAEPPPAESLHALYEEQLRPELAARRRPGRRRISTNRLNQYAAAIAAFDRFVGRYSTAGDVTNERLAAFRADLVARGRGESTAYAYGLALRRVARLHDPVAFADRRRSIELPPPEAGSVREFFETVYLPERLTGTKPFTAYMTRWTLRLFVEHVGRDVAVGELSDVLVSGFLNALVARGMAAVTINRHRARVRALWKLAHERRLIDIEPRGKKLRESLDAPDAWDEEELRRIIDAPRLVPWRQSIAGVAAPLWWRAIFLTCFYTALRRGTLLRLRRREVNLETGWLNVPGKLMKNGIGKRYKLPPEAVAAIAAMQSTHERLFYWPHNDTTLHAQFRKIIAAAGVAPSTRAVCTQFHKFRRSTATLICASRGMHAASEALGHSSTEITKRYLDNTKLPGQDITAILPNVGTSPAAPVPLLLAAPDAPSNEPAGDPVPSVAGELLDPGAAALAERMEQAQELFAQARFELAAVAARIVLERWLAALAQRHGLRGKSAGQHVHSLASHDLIDQPQRQKLLGYTRTANRAAHGQAVRPDAVAELVAGVSALITAPITN